nr:MAG: DUF998 domain-containing protein [Hyphomicrobiales bacterium]
MIRITPIALVLFGIVVIAIAMIVGPIFSPSEFSWLRDSTSEQASQHLPGAWIMRMGFVAYGLGTLSAALSDWPPHSIVRGALALFGLGLIGTAIWSNAPILPNVPADMHEDWLHSVASGVVGTAFATACAARLFAPGGSRRDFLAWVGLVVSVTIPLAMGELPEYRGALQRAMFAISFVFVIREFKASKFGIFPRRGAGRILP